MLKGSMPALVTPFDENGKLDEQTFAEFIDWQILEGSNGLVPVGTTGECPVLSHDEHKKAIEVCIRAADKRVPVLAGAGSNNTEEAIDLSRSAEELGADAVMSVVPYYNKPNQRGMYAHFAAVAKSVSIPVYIYNVPGRTVADISVETVDALYRDFDNIVGIKDATGDLSRVPAQRLLSGPDFVQLSGEDATAMDVIVHGGHGCISVTANVAPRLCSEFQAACLSGNFEEARRIQALLMPLHGAMFMEPSPTCPKYALSLLGKMNKSVRLPLVDIEPETEDKIKAAMRHAGILN